MSSFSLRYWMIPIICLMITFYFIYHSIQGNRGIRRMDQLTAEIQLAQTIARDTKKQRTLLQTKVHALSPHHLDLDQLEESAIRILNMGNKEDRVIFN